MTATDDRPTDAQPAEPGEPGAELRRLLEALDEQVLGQQDAIAQLVAAYAAGGHVLIEGVPGLGKTLLARTFAACLGLEFARIQFTPDLMPGDVVGVNVFSSTSSEFRLQRGPIFTDILMADEINRTPPKTQSALLEAMQESQVTIDGVIHPLPEDFFVIATQNPIEFEGVYSLPESQLDRFLLRIEIGLPAAEAEIEIYRRGVAGTLAGWGGEAPRAVLTADQARRLRQASATVHVDEELIAYAQRLAESLRDNDRVELGVSPRGVLALLAAGRGTALVGGRDFLVPDDLKRMLRPCWGHRILLSPEAEIEGHDTAAVLQQLAETVEAPS